MKVGVLALLVLSACGDNSGKQPPPASCLPGCTAVRTYDALSYALHAHYDWTAAKLDATEDVGLDISASGPIVELDAAVDVHAVYDGDQALAFVADAANGTLAIDTTPLGTTGTVAFAIDYAADPSGTLIPTRSRDDDPVTSRVVYTDSEPNRAHYWHPTKLDPSDRALWSVDLTVEPDEDVIANGARTSDSTTADGKREVTYALDKPIPTYLMAFAAGQLEHTDRTTGRVPLSVWHRKGLVLDPDATLDAVAEAMAVFEQRMIPYPWDSYTVVLLPYGGGMENATITFDNETSGQGTIDFGLVAHELGHHWFGDWVTMHDYDDVWFKEGMATTLQVEADNARRDREGKGRRWGITYRYSASDAIVDDTLVGIDKYTTGPYQRAAWLIGQIRATVGETAFWDGLRGVLAAHAIGSATGEQFIRSFPLDEATVQRLLAALPQHGTPTITVATTASSTKTTVNLALADPTNLVLAPIDITVVDAAGAATTSHLTASTPVSVDVPAGGYLATDEGDTHPAFNTNFGVASADFTPLRALFAPAPTAAPAVLAAFASRSAAAQERAVALPIANPSQLATYVAALDSNPARQTAAVLACTAGQTDAAWMTAVAPILETPPRLFYDTRFAACGTAYPIATLKPELATALATASPASLARAAYLLSFDYGAQTLATIGPVMTTAPSLTLRETAMYRLMMQAEQYGPYPAVPDADVPAWNALFEGELSSTMSENRFYNVVGVLETFADVAALPRIAPLLHQLVLSSDAQVFAVCAAYYIAGGSTTAWTTFQADTQPWTSLAPAAAADLQDPTSCGTAKQHTVSRELPIDRRGAR